MVQNYRASIIIPCRNTHIKFIHKILDALIIQKHITTCEVVLVMNEPVVQDETKHPHTLINIRVIKTSSKNPGVQRNLGAQNTKSPLLIFLDADCIPGDKWLEEIFAVMDECSPHGIQGVDFSLTSGKVEQALSRGHRQYLDNGLVQGRMSLVDTRNLCLLRNAFDSVGGFDEKLPSLEDRDLGRRLYNAGFNIILSERVIVYHRWDKGNFYTFFRWGMWYGEGEFIFVLKWQGLNKKGMALDIIISTYKRIRMSLGKWLREPSETNFLFLIKEMGISTGKLSAFLLHILNT